MAQSEHTDAPPEEYFPEAQASEQAELLSSVALPKFPGGQTVHEPAAINEKLPLVQAAHALDPAAAY